MFVARLICSDPACAAELDAEAPTAAELETLLCHCGCALEVIAWADWVEDPADVVALQPRAQPPLPHAA